MSKKQIQRLKMMIEELRKSSEKSKPIKGAQLIQYLSGCLDGIE